MIQNHYTSKYLCILHPRRLTWNLRIHPWKRKIIFQTIIFRFYVNLRGCTEFSQLFLHLGTTHPNPNLECGDGCGSSESTGDPTGEDAPSTWGRPRPRPMRPTWAGWGKRSAPKLMGKLRCPDGIKVEMVNFTIPNWMVTLKK